MAFLRWLASAVGLLVVGAFYLALGILLTIFVVVIATSI